MATVVIPEIVLEELLGLYKRELITRVSSAHKSIGELNQIIQDQLDWEVSVEIDKELEKYRNHLLEKFNSYYLDRLPYKNSYLQEIVQRSIQRIKPISAKGEEFRDSILWLSIIDYLKVNSRDEVVFISNNVKDFGNSDGTNLHQDLLEELNRNKVKLQYHRSLKDFLQDFAISVDFISKSWLKEKIDWDKLNENAIDAVNSIHYNFFFEYHSRHPNLEEDLHSWQVLEAEFQRDNPTFFIYETSKSEQYNLELHLIGNAKIQFENDESSIKIIDDVQFYTQIMVVVNEDEVIEYKETYYQEETGLLFVEETSS